MGLLRFNSWFGVSSGPTFAVALGVSVTLHGALFTALACLPAPRQSPGDEPVMQVALGHPLSSSSPVNERKPFEPLDTQRTKSIEHSGVNQQILKTVSGPQRISAEVSARPLLEFTNQTGSFERLAQQSAAATADGAIFDESTQSVGQHEADQSQFEQSSESSVNETDTGSHEPARDESSAEPRRQSPAQPDQKQQAKKPDTPSQPNRGGVEKGVDVVDLPRPAYPARCVRLGQEGTVLVRVHVGIDGDVREVHLHRSSGVQRLNEAALDAARNGRFKPAERDGEPVEATVVIPFEFELR